MWGEIWLLVWLGGDLRCESERESRWRRCGAHENGVKSVDFAGGFGGNFRFFRSVGSFVRVVRGVCRVRPVPIPWLLEFLLWETHLDSTISRHFPFRN